MHDKFYLSAITSVFDGCQSPTFSGAQDKAKADIAAGRQDTRIAELVANGRSDLNDSAQAISAVAWPKNEVDLEVLGRLMKRIVWSNAAFELGIELAEEYNSSRHPGLLVDVYANLMAPGADLPLLEKFVTAYPWSSAPCHATPESITALEARVSATLDATIAKANSLRPPGEGVDLSTNYGRLVLDWTPALAFLGEHGWWPGMLWYEYIIEDSSRYWDHYNDAVLPTAEEAMFLVASYLNESRTLIWDEQLALLQGNIPYRDWENEPFWATVVIASADPVWTYGRLPCGT